MGVGAPQGRHPAVQVVTQGQLFAGGLGVEVHQGEIRLAFCQQGVRRGKGVVCFPVQPAAANEVHHPHPDSAQVENLAAVARRPPRVVGGAQQPGNVVQQLPELHFPEGVVAQSDGVGPGVVDAPGLLRRHAHAGGVFAVDYGEGDIFQLLQGAQVLFQVPQARLPHHVAHRQNVILHRLLLIPGPAGRPARKGPGCGSPPPSPAGRHQTNRRGYPRSSPPARPAPGPLLPGSGPCPGRGSR